MEFYVRYITSSRKKNDKRISAPIFAQILIRIIYRKSALSFMNIFILGIVDIDIDF